MGREGISGEEEKRKVALVVIPLLDRPITMNTPDICLEATKQRRRMVVVVEGEETGVLYIR